MEIVPAIDIRGGKCVRLVQGDPSRETQYAEDPVEVARYFRECGARHVHVVDLDGAFTGKSPNAPIIRKIAFLPGVKVELGGGIRTLEAVAYWLEQGVQEVILGTVAVERPGLVEEAVVRFGPERVAVALDIRGERIAVRGWQQVSRHSAMAVAERMWDAGVRRFIVTDVRRDGTLAGPAIKRLVKIAQILDARITASGGIRDRNDLRELLNLEPLGVDRVVVGKAIYEGRLNLKETVKWLRAAENEERDAG